jgi:hypothetical protein
VGVALERTTGATVWEHARSTLVDGVLYARDRREIVALDLRAD